jgi:5-formyltetrahydrofolate cyclo-ligase
LFLNNFNLENIRTAHVFLPIRRKNEINTWLIIQKLRTDYPALKVAVSVSNTQEYTLSHFWLQPQTELQENKWGIPEPQNAEAVPVEAIDLVLVPLLAFDKLGHRVGYGKGFYDRFLKACRPETIKIGLSLEAALAQISDVHADDIMLDYAITPTQILKFI